MQFENTHFVLELDTKTGAIHRLDDKKTHRQWASPEHPLALFSYQKFSQADINRFATSYAVVKEPWIYQAFGKPDIDRWSAESRIWQPHLTGCWSGRNEDGLRVLTQLKIMDEHSESHGIVAWPRTMYMELRLPDDEAVIHIDFLWFGKVANRLPEAMWLSFVPIAPESNGWMLQKVDSPVSPFDVIAGGNRHMHAITEGMSYQDANGRFIVETMDALVVALGEQSPIYYSNAQPDLQKGIHFSLFNNTWGTNYPQWFAEDMRFRFSLRT